MNALKLVHSQPEEEVQIMVEMRTFWNWPLILILLFTLMFDGAVLYLTVKGIEKWQDTNTSTSSQPHEAARQQPRP